MSNELHVVPRGDFIDHEDEDCACGPTTEPVTRDDGSVGWVIIHHSLDGRETRPIPPGSGDHAGGAR